MTPSSDDGAMIRLDRASKALSEVVTLKEAASYANQAEAFKVCLIKAGKSLETQNHAAELHVRFCRRAGELSRELPKAERAGAGRPRKDGKLSPSVDAITKSSALKDVGLSRQAAARNEAVAALPDEKFEAYIEQTKPTKELTMSGLYRIANLHRKKLRRKETKGLASSDSGIVTSLSELEGQTFGCIYADPPWKYSNQSTRASTDNHYDTMTVEDICALPIGELATTNAHLHLWTTNAFLFECPKIFKAWGFEFKSSFVWVKPQMGIGNYWRNAHEFLLLAVKGKQTALSAREMSWMEAKRTKHSKKPSGIPQILERLSPGPYLELFGRESRRNWTVFGDEVSKMLL